jgi:hypothetical protein
MKLMYYWDDVAKSILHIDTIDLSSTSIDNTSARIEEDTYDQLYNTSKFFFNM